MNRLGPLKKLTLFTMALLTFLMTSAVVSSTPLASAQTHFAESSAHIQVAYGGEPNDGEVAGGGMLVNMLVYVWSFLREVARHWFEPGGGTTWQWSSSDDDWILVGKTIPDMTPQGKAMVGAFVDVVDNLLIYLDHALQVVAAPTNSGSNQ